MSRPVTYCTVEGCGKRHHGHGYCRACWRRWRRYGDPSHVVYAPQAALCTVENCEQETVAKSLCKLHYDRYRRTGTTTRTVRRCEIPGCDAKHFARDLCSRHYYMMRYERDQKPQQRPWLDAAPIADVIQMSLFNDKELARMTGVTHRTILRIRMGHHRFIQEGTADKIVTALGRHLDEVYGEAA